MLFWPCPLCASKRNHQQSDVEPFSWFPAAIGSPRLSWPAHTLTLGTGQSDCFTGNHSSNTQHPVRSPTTWHTSTSTYCCYSPPPVVVPHKEKVSVPSSSFLILALLDDLDPKPSYLDLRQVSFISPSSLAHCHCPVEPLRPSPSSCSSSPIA